MPETLLGPPRILGLAGILVLGLLTGCGNGDDDTAARTQTEAGAAEEAPHFSYRGKTGPSHWGQIDPSYAECSAGEAQSPINLSEGRPSTEPQLEVSYEPAELELENNGHTIVADYPAGSTIDLGSTEYELDQFHFHSPSEHTIAGRTFPLEFHFVNEAEDGTLAVLGVMAMEGTENPAFSKLVGALPPKEDESRAVNGEVNAADLLPADPASVPRWSYRGSLTTPPCTEGVRWSVFNQPLALSSDQIASYMAVFEGNNRPMQPLNGRKVLLVEP